MAGWLAPLGQGHPDLLRVTEGSGAALQMWVLPTGPAAASGHVLAPLLTLLP